MVSSQESLSYNQALEVNLADDLQSQNFDVIRLASYRTAVKLRFIQRRTHLHLIDVWNLIEAYRENGLNAVDLYTPMTLCRLETLISTLYVHLNKRVPVSQQLHVHPATLYLMQWIVQVYNVEEIDRIPVFTVKLLLAMLCGGKLTDKLRFMFSQMSDANGHLITSNFDDFLRQTLLVTVAIGEEANFHYKPSLTASIFPAGTKVSVNDFLDTLLGEPGPPCLVWLPLLHRIAAAETVVHPVQCVSCQKGPFYGLRYQCNRCPVNLSHQCQECFWRGVALSDSHKPEHEIREYYTPKNPKQPNSLGTALRRSLRCVRTPDSRDEDQAKLWRNMEGPEKSTVLTYSPSTPSTIQRSSTMGSVDTWGNSLQRNVQSWSREDDEHGLIARYSNKLASMANDEVASIGALSEHNKTATGAQQLLAQLESKNQEILREIARIRREQEKDGMREGSGNVPLMEELTVLRQRKGELEQQLLGLQDSRKQLMGQLEMLMKMIKNQQLSPRSSPSSSTSPSGGKSPVSGAVKVSTEVLAPLSADSLAESDGRASKLGSSWRQDLLSAADSVTDAMSCLVKEFKGEEEDSREFKFNGKHDSEGTCGHETTVAN